MGMSGRPRFPSSMTMLMAHGPLKVLSVCLLWAAGGSPAQLLGTQWAELGLGLGCCARAVSGMGLNSGPQPALLCSTSRTWHGPSTSQAGSPTLWCCSRCGCLGRSGTLEPSASSPATANSRQEGAGGLMGCGAGRLYRRGRGLAAGHGPRVLSTAQQGMSQDDLGLLRHTKRQQKLIQGLGEEGDEKLDLDWASDSSSLLRSLEDEVGTPGRAAGVGGGGQRSVP